MLKHVSIAAFLSLALGACSDSSSSDSPGLITASSGFIFTGATSTAWPWQNNFYRLDPETFDIQKLLSGESSDTAIFSIGDDALFFNRTTESLNYRLLKADTDKKIFTIGAQTQFADAFVSDPHDALQLDANTALLAHYNSGKLPIMNITTGEKLGEVTADWDLPEGVMFMPEAFWRTTVNGHTYIYVIHQAAAYEGSTYTVNGSQRVFVLEQSGTTVTPVDLDPATPKVQGIKTVGSFPITLSGESDKLILVSLCSRFVSPSPSVPTNVCKSAVEEIDPATQTVTTLWDLDNSGFYMNGGVVSTGSSDSFFAQVEQQEGEAYPRRIVKFDLAAKQTSKVYDYAEGSGGYYGLYYDDVRGNLFIGDINTDSVGKFTILKQDGSTVVKTLDGIPSSISSI